VLSMVRFAVAMRRNVARMPAAACIGVLALLAAPGGAGAQTQPQGPRNAVASECLAMAQKLPNARYASLDAPQFLPVAAKPPVTIRDGLQRSLSCAR
jgi:hypothetical protein